MLVQEYGGVMMARPRKMTTEQMISVVDSYYFIYANENEKRMKCSLIAAYAVELGYQAKGYDFARNIEVREHIERLKCMAEIGVESNGGENFAASYKSLDVDELMHRNKSPIELAKALTELDSYWKKVYERSNMLVGKNRELKQKNADLDLLNTSLKNELEALRDDYTDICKKKNELTTENRYLRKMLKKYLYPAIANEILLKENALKDVDTTITDKAVSDMVELNRPQSVGEQMSQDVKLQSEEELLLSKMWGICDD